MYDSKLIKSLKSLDKKEIRRFEEFVQSPFFNKSEDATTFCIAILKFAPDFSSPQLKKEKFIKKHTLDEKRLPYLLNQSMTLFEEFLAFLSLEKDEAQRSIYRMDQFLQRNLDSLFQAESKKLKKSLDAENQPLSHYETLLKVNEKELEFGASTNIRAYQESLQTTVDSLDLHYLLMKLRYSAAILNQQAIIASGYEIRFLEEIQTYLEKEQIENVEIRIYFHIVRMLQNNTEEDFEALKKLLRDQGKKLQKSTLREVYAFALNFCIRQTRQGKLNYQDELFQLYQVLVDQKVLLENGHISPWHYKNIVTSGLRTKSYDWTLNFIESHKSKLPESHRSNAYTYNLANFHYAQKNYDKGMRLLNQVEFDDPFLNISAKVLLAKMYFEENELEALYNLLESFRKFLERNKQVAENVIDANKNFIRHCRQLMRMHEGDEDSLKSLKVRRSKRKLGWLKRRGSWSV